MPPNDGDREQGGRVTGAADARTDPVRFGTSSFSAPGWVGSFYPAGSSPRDFLSLYAQRYDTVEVDATYYAVPSERTVDGWAARTPESFLICAKFPRSIVHGGHGARPAPDRVLLPSATYGDRDRFLSVMSRLGTRLGPLILQFPYFPRAAIPSREEFLQRLERFLEDLPPDLEVGVEIRNRNWLGPELADLCRRHGTALVLVDHAWMPRPEEFQSRFDPVTADFCYIRLLGDRKATEALTNSWDREVLDRGESLARWATFLAGLAARRIRTLVYVNNHYAGHAPSTVDRLRRLYLTRSGPGFKDPAAGPDGRPNSNGLKR